MVLQLLATILPVIALLTVLFDMHVWATIMAMYFSFVTAFILQTIVLMGIHKDVMKIHEHVSKAYLQELERALDDGADKLKELMKDEEGNVPEKNVSKLEEYVDNLFTSEGRKQD